LPPLHGLIRGVSYFYTSPNIVTVMKSIRILEAESDTLGRQREMHARFWYGNLKERNHLEDLGIGGRTLKFVF